MVASLVPLCLPSTPAQRPGITLSLISHPPGLKTIPVTSSDHDLRTLPRFKTRQDYRPASDVHVFDVKKRKWSQAIPMPTEVDPPARAYHAACLTPSGKYIAIHGGLSSDFDDCTALSATFFLFDVQNHKWLQPALHANTDGPPLPRNQHSLVEGVGRHRGFLVMYGGFLGDETFSQEMFLCRVFEPGLPDQRVEVLWEKVEVRTTIGRPLPGGDDQAYGQVLTEGGAALACGCMVPLADMGKYIIVGGKNGHGMRTAPLMLDPRGSDEMAFSESVGIPEDLYAPRKVRKQVSPTALKVKNFRHGPPSPQGQCNDLKHHASAAVIDDEHDIQGIGRSPSPAAVAPEMPRASSIQRTSSEKSPLPTAGSRGKVSAGGLGSDRFRRRKPRVTVLEASPEVLPATSNVVQPAPNPAEQVAENDPAKKAEALLFKSRLVRSNKDTANAEVAYPPLKKRRIRSGTKLVEEPKFDDAHPIISPAPLVNDPIVEDNEAEVQENDVKQTMSAQSDFIAPSEIKRLGRTTSTKANGSRGRGRIATIRQKEAELDASRKKIEAQQETIRRSTLENVKLVDENNELKVANRKFKIDNQGLNKEMQRLLQEVQSLRNQVSAQQTSGTRAALTSCGPIRAQDENVSRNVASSCEDDGVCPSSASKSWKAKEIRTRRGNTDDLREQNVAISLEKESLVQDLKECEEERRHIERELNRTRNLLEKSQVECGKLRVRANDCDKTIKEAVDSREVMWNKLQSAEHDIVVLKSKNEALNLNLMEEKHKLGDVMSERIAREQEVRKLKTELTEQQKQYGDNDGKRRLLECELESQKGKYEDLNKVLGANTDKMRKVEVKYAEVVAERDMLRSELDEKVREHDAALVANHKNKAAIDALRKELCDESIEHKRMKRELDVRTKECEKLKARLARLHMSTKSMRPLLVQFSKQFEQFAREGAAADANEVISSPEVVTGEAQEHDAEVNGSVETRAGGEAAQAAVMNGSARNGRNADMQEMKEIPESDEGAAGAAEQEEEP
eukprot:TRINITY_DN2503_c0_g2_i1.p1 TRINITY_DN2503_c0_g2~~TRINITY_DN2503_c0_g2_i1.p1  ORF type:complete len:1018 (-),score=196.71 TRINITY_DN2503_c0_g2_i1:850-3903(-)